MRIAVLGAGAGGHAMAADLTLKGHQVALCSGNPEKLAALRARGGVAVTGVLGERLVPLARVGGDIAAAVADADLVVLPVPGMVQESYLRRTLPHVEAGQLVLLCPGTGGALVARRILRELGKDGVLLADTLTLPYGARMTGPAAVAVPLRIRTPCAALPARRTAEALDRLGDCFDLQPARNVLETALMNVNAIIHPLPSLMSWAWIERSERSLSVYLDGMSPGVLKCLYATDRERVAVCAAAGVSTLAIDDIYRLLGLSLIYKDPPRLGKADHYEDRFIGEDVPVGLVTIATVGAQLSVATPLIAGVIQLAGTLYDTDYWATGRTAEKLGLAGLDADQLAELLQEGEAGSA
jgi:opine dehydrogenase